MAFEFDPNARPRALSDKAILENLRKFAISRRGKPTTARAFSTWRGRACSMQLVTLRFGSWNAAIRQVGAGIGGPKPVEPIKLIRNLERIWRKLGHPPGADKLRRLGPYHVQPYRARWGSLRQACLLLARVHAGKLTLEEMIALARSAPKRRRRQILRATIRWRILERDRFRCRTCGRGPRSRSAVTLHVDHIIPVSRGGTNDPSNLRTLCSECNIGRGAGRKPLPPVRLRYPATRTSRARRAA